MALAPCPYFHQRLAEILREKGKPPPVAAVVQETTRGRIVRFERQEPRKGREGD